MNKKRDQEKEKEYTVVTQNIREQGTGKCDLLLVDFFVLPIGNKKKNAREQNFMAYIC